MLPTLNDDELYQGYFTKVYQHTNDLPSYAIEERESLAKQGICTTYGELLYPSVKKLIHKMALTDSDTFLDLGSGVGKCALQVFMQSEAKSVIGIEASSELHQQAIRGLSQIKADFPFYWEDDRECAFKEGNFLHVPWSASVIYSCSTCFTQSLLLAMAEKINYSPSIKKVFSLRPLPSLHMPLKEVFQVECTWDTTLCFYYALNS